MMKILFLCTHNACRSILAESIARQIGSDVWTVASAGSDPAGRVHSDTLVELQARHFPVAGLHSKSWDDVQDFKPDVVITVCDQAAGESCPVWFGRAIKAHWGLPDPTKLADPQERMQGFTQVISTLDFRLSILANTIRKGMPPSEQLAAMLKKLAED